MAQVETTDEMETRLLRVIAQAHFEVLAQDYTWRRMAHNQPPSQKAIACVRDGEAWYEFLPAERAILLRGIASSASISAKAQMRLALLLG